MLTLVERDPLRTPRSQPPWPRLPVPRSNVALGVAAAAPHAALGIPAAEPAANAAAPAAPVAGGLALRAAGPEAAALGPSGAALPPLAATLAPLAGGLTLCSAETGPEAAPLGPPALALPLPAAALATSAAALAPPLLRDWHFRRRRLGPRPMPRCPLLQLCPLLRRRWPPPLRRWPPLAGELALCSAETGPEATSLGTSGAALPPQAAAPAPPASALAPLARGLASRAAETGHGAAALGCPSAGLPPSAATFAAPSAAMASHASARAAPTAVPEREAFDDDGQSDPHAICRGELDATDSTSATCGHTFHRGCLSEWLVVRPNCPLCRSKFPTAAAAAPLLSAPALRPRRAGAYGLFDIRDWDDSDSEAYVAQLGASAPCSMLSPVTATGGGPRPVDLEVLHSPASRDCLALAEALHFAVDAPPRFVVPSPPHGGMDASATVAGSPPADGSH